MNKIYLLVSRPLFLIKIRIFTKNFNFFNKFCQNLDKKFKIDQILFKFHIFNSNSQFKIPNSSKKH